MRAVTTDVTVILMVLGFLGVLLAIQPATSAAATEEENPCAGTPPNATTLLADVPGKQVLRGKTDAILYPDSQLRLILCRGNTSAPVTTWGVNLPPGITVTREPSDTSRSLSVTVTNAAEQVRITQAHLSNVSGPITLSFRIRQYYRVSSNFSGIESITFSNETLATRYRESERKFLNAKDRLLKQSDDIRSFTGDSPNQHLPTITNTTDLRSLLEHKNTLVEVLFTTGMQTKDETVARALDRVRSVSRQAQNEYVTALQAYDKKIANDLSSRLKSLRLKFVGIFVGSIVFGALIGVINPYRHYKKTAYDQQFTRVEYSWRVLIYPVVLSLIVLVATIIIGVFVLNTPIQKLGVLL
ncbi:MAG: hypothetical protein ABEI52_12495 [Halobacteriaceae archaeon]